VRRGAAADAPPLAALAGRVRPDRRVARAGGGRGRHRLALAVELAGCQRLVKGYGETHVRGWRNFETVTGALPRLRGAPDAAARLRRLRDAALADEHGHALRDALAALDPPATRAS
jgi:hypothetical protein